MKPITRIQLMLMMFLLYFMWGAWYGQMSKYMLSSAFNGGKGATGAQVGNAYLAFSIATIAAPFFCGNDCGSVFCGPESHGDPEYFGRHRDVFRDADH